MVGHLSSPCRQGILRRRRAVPRGRPKDARRCDEAVVFVAHPRLRTSAFHVRDTSVPTPRTGRRSGVDRGIMRQPSCVGGSPYLAVWLNAVESAGRALGRASFKAREAASTSSTHAFLRRLVAVVLCAAVGQSAAPTGYQDFSISSRAEPMFRIHLPPAASLRTLGPSAAEHSGISFCSDRLQTTRGRGGPAAWGISVRCCGLACEQFLLSQRVTSRYPGRCATISSVCRYRSSARSAVADFGRVKVTGAAAWWLWGAGHVFFLVGVRNRLSVVLGWVWSYFSEGDWPRISAEWLAAARS
jgi:hypothetical protein